MQGIIDIDRNSESLLARSAISSSGFKSLLSNKVISMLCGLSCIGSGFASPRDGEYKESKVAVSVSLVGSRAKSSSVDSSASFNINHINQGKGAYCGTAINDDGYPMH